MDTADARGMASGTGVLAPPLALLREAVTALTRLPPELLDVGEAATVHDELRSLSDRIRAFAARLLCHVEADGRWASVGGSRTFPEWVAQRAGSSVGSARQEVALGRALAEDLPVTRAAVDSGRISLEHAQVLTRLAPTSDARRAVLASDRPDLNEASLVDAATRLGVDDYRRTVRRWAAVVDDAAHEAEHVAAEAREHLYLTRRGDGMDVQGFLTSEHGDVLMTALRAVTGVPAGDDTRTTEQRRAAALTGLARLALDRGLLGAGGALVRPHISVHVSWETMQRLAREHPGHPERPDSTAGDTGRPADPAELDDGTPIPASVLARIACDSEITRVVFGPTSQPVDVGRGQRTFTGTLRRAIVARDRHCQYPGCSAPPALGEVHHARWWGRDGGTTSVGNGVLLCWYHHKIVHQRDLAVSQSGDGTWVFRRPDDVAVSPPRTTPPGGTAAQPKEIPPGEEAGPPMVAARESPPARDPGAPGHVQGQLRLAG